MLAIVRPLTLCRRLDMCVVPDACESSENLICIETSSLVGAGLSSLSEWQMDRKSRYMHKLLNSSTMHTVSSKPLSVSADLECLCRCWAHNRSARQRLESASEQLRLHHRLGDDLIPGLKSVCRQMGCPSYVSSGSAGSHISTQGATSGPIHPPPTPSSKSSYRALQVASNGPQGPGAGLAVHQQLQSQGCRLKLRQPPCQGSKSSARLPPWALPCSQSR